MSLPPSLLLRACAYGAQAQAELQALMQPVHRALAKSLKSNASLKVLDLRYCRIKDEGKRALREAVKGRKGFDLLGLCL